MASRDFLLRRPLVHAALAAQLELEMLDGVGDVDLAAVDAGLGYLPILRSLLPSRFVEEEPGVLPVLPPITIGVALRDDLDIKDLTPLIETFADVLAPSHEADAVKSWD